MIHCVQHHPIGIVPWCAHRCGTRPYPPALVRGEPVQQTANQLTCHSEPVLFPGVGISTVQQTAFQFLCHSEPVRRLVWESPSSLRTRSSNQEIATPVCALARNDANKRPHSQKRVIPNQFSNWCGNPRRTADSIPIFMSFRTSPQTGVGIPTVIETTFFYRWRLPRQCAHWLAMTRIRDRILKNVSFRTSSQTGVGISAVQQTAFQFLCHSEPVRRLVWESPSSLRTRSSNQKIATPVCALARNDANKRPHSQKRVIPNQSADWYRGEHD